MANRIYERVSGVKQKADSQHLELERWATAQTAENVWYPADKFTGKSMDRPVFNRLMNDLRRGDTLVVWRLDRLGRTASGLTTLFDTLLARGINLVSVRDGIDLSTAAGKMVANIIASVAAYETEVRAERVQAGIQARREKIDSGEITVVNLGGRPKGSGKVTPALRTTILRMKAEGTPVAQIARELHLSRQAVHSVIKAATTTASQE